MVKLVYATGRRAIVALVGLRGCETKTAQRPDRCLFRYFYCASMALRSCWLCLGSCIFSAWPGGVGHRRRPDCMATGLVWLWLLLAVGVNVSVLRPWFATGWANRLAGRGGGVRSAAFRNVPFQAAKRHVSHVDTCRLGVPNGRYAASALGWRLVVVSFFAGAMVPAFRWHWLRLAFFTWRRPCHECRRRPLPGWRPVGFCCIGRNWAAMAAWGGCRFRGECWQRLCRLAATLAIWLEPGAIRLR